MSDIKDFVWTDELVKEFVYFKQISFPVLSTEQRIEEFKKSKQPKPLFTSEDGVEIFEGDEVFSVRKCDWLNSDSIFKAHLGSLSLSIYKETNHWWYFSNKEAANQFVLLNKPIEVSYKEFLEAYDKQPNYTMTRTFFKEFFQSKINL